MEARVSDSGAGSLSTEAFPSVSLRLQRRRWSSNFLLSTMRSLPWTALCFHREASTPEPHCHGSQSIYGAAVPPDSGPWHAANEWECFPRKGKLGIMLSDGSRLTGADPEPR